MYVTSFVLCAVFPTAQQTSCRRERPKDVFSRFVQHIHHSTDPAPFPAPGWDFPLFGAMSQKGQGSPGVSSSRKPQRARTLWSGLFLLSGSTAACPCISTESTGGLAGTFLFCSRLHGCRCFSCGVPCRRVFHTDIMTGLPGRPHCREGFHRRPAADIPSRGSAVRRSGRYGWWNSGLPHSRPRHGAAGRHADAPRRCCH